MYAVRSALANTDLAVVNTYTSFTAATAAALANTDLAVVNTYTSFTAATAAALALSTDAAADAYPLTRITVTDLTSNTDLVNIDQLAVHAALYL